VLGAPGASAGRTVMNPSVVALTTVTFGNTEVAPGGTTCCGPLAVGMLPVTVRSCPVADTNGPASPTLFGSRVSSTRTGVIDTMSDGALDAASTSPTKPPAPSETATVAPMAAQRERQSRPRSSFVEVEDGWDGWCVVVNITPRSAPLPRRGIGNRCLETGHLHSAVAVAAAVVSRRPTVTSTEADASLSVRP